jgi:hypothetical protein
MATTPTRLADALREIDRLRAENEALRKTKHELAKALLATRTEADELRAALQRLADRRYDLCPTQIVHIVNTALRGEGE